MVLGILTIFALVYFGQGDGSNMSLPDNCAGAALAEEVTNTSSVETDANGGHALAIANCTPDPRYFSVSPLHSEGILVSCDSLNDAKAECGVASESGLPVVTVLTLPYEEVTVPIVADGDGCPLVRLEQVTGFDGEDSGSVAVIQPLC